MPSLLAPHLLICEGWQEGVWLSPGHSQGRSQPPWEPRSWPRLHRPGSGCSHRGEGLPEVKRQGGPQTPDSRSQLPLLDAQVRRPPGHVASWLVALLGWGRGPLPFRSPQGPCLAHTPPNTGPPPRRPRARPFSPQKMSDLV